MSQEDINAQRREKHRNMTPEQRAKRNQYCRDYYYAHLEESKKARHDWYVQNKARHRAASDRWNAAHPDYDLQRRERGYWQEHQEELKSKVLTHYSNAPVPQCVNPFRIHIEPFTILDALQLDHINGGGKQERIKFGQSSSYVRLIKAGFPEGYQTLCANCNQIKRKRNGEGWGRGAKVKAKDRIAMAKPRDVANAESLGAIIGPHIP